MSKHNNHRLEQFSDGVFSIAITLLAIELHVPRLFNATISGAMNEIIPLLPGVLAFVLSFVTIAIFWVNHHQLTQSLTSIKRRVLWTNILFLMFVTLIPFSSAVISANPFHPLAMVAYSFILLAGSISFTLLRYFVHKSCGDNSIPMGRSFVGPVFYLLAVVASFFSVPAAAVMLIIPPLFYFLPKSSIR